MTTSIASSSSLIRSLYSRSAPWIENQENPRRVLLLPAAQLPSFSTVPIPIPSRTKILYSRKPAAVIMSNINVGACDHERSNFVVGVGDGIVIVDHGSRSNDSNVMLNEFVAIFQERTGYGIVEPAHMELAKPSIKDAFDVCVKRGASRVIVSPFFLAPGRHWKQDIPALAAEAAKDHPGVSFIVTAPLGCHELLVDVMNERIKHCLSHVSGEADECNACTGMGKCRQLAF